MNFPRKNATYLIKRAKKKEDLTDAMLIAAIARKDKEALKTLYLRYNKKIYRFAFKHLNNYEASQDITSEVFLTIWEKAGTFQGRSRVSTWIFGIAYNKIRGTIRKKNMFELGLNDVPVETASKIDAKYDFSQAFERLSISQKEVVEMIFYLGLSYKETAEIIGCPEGTVKSRAFHARKNLQATLSGQIMEGRKP